MDVSMAVWTDLDITVASAARVAVLLAAVDVPLDAPAVVAVVGVAVADRVGADVVAISELTSLGLLAATGHLLATQPA